MITVVVTLCQFRSAELMKVVNGCFAKWRSEFSAARVVASVLAIGVSREHMADAGCYAASHSLQVNSLLIGLETINGDNDPGLSRDWCFLCDGRTCPERSTGAKA
jgi:hypothetical protein